MAHRLLNEHLLDCSFPLLLRLTGQSRPLKDVLPRLIPFVDNEIGGPKGSFPNLSQNGIVIHFVTLRTSRSVSCRPPCVPPKVAPTQKADAITLCWALAAPQ